MVYSAKHLACYGQYLAFSQRLVHLVQGGAEPYWPTGIPETMGDGRVIVLYVLFTLQTF